ncbi:MAG: flagellin [Pseudomonadota bacterium]
MTRIATVPLQQVMSNAIQRAQAKLATSQQNLATTKKANTFADLGSESVRNLSAHSMLARQSAETTVAKRVQTTLSLYDAQLTGIDTSSENLRQSILTALGNGQTSGLQSTIDGAFEQYRNALNSTEGGVAMFGGSQTDTPPFKPKALSDLVGLPQSDAFANDSVVASARIADGVDVPYGVGASTAGGGLYTAFQSLAQAGPIGAALTPAQKTALTTVVDQLQSGLGSLRAVNAENGRRTTQVESMINSGDQRKTLLTGVIGANEDADLGQVATDISQQKTILEASYSVFSQLAGLSLVQYLK